MITFLTLPAEMRRQVYRYLVSSTKVVVVKRDSASPSNAIGVAEWPYDVVIEGTEMLATCRQIYREAGPILLPIPYLTVPVAAILHPNLPDSFNSAVLRHALSTALVRTQDNTVFFYIKAVQNRQLVVVAKRDCRLSFEECSDATIDEEFGNAIGNDASRSILKEVVVGHLGYWLLEAEAHDNPEETRANELENNVRDDTDAAPQNELEDNPEDILETCKAKFEKLHDVLRVMREDYQLYARMKHILKRKADDPGRIMVVSLGTFAE